MKDIDMAVAELKLIAAQYPCTFDRHRRTAAHIFKVDESEVTSEMRLYAKRVSFFRLYSERPAMCNLTKATP